MRRDTAWGALRHRPFRLLIGARAVGLLGNAIAPIALAFAVLDLTGSAVDLGLVVGTRSIVNVALLLVGGVIADRLPRQFVLVGSSLAAMATQAVIAATVLTGMATIPVLLILSALNGAAAAFSQPASAALVAQTVPEDQRQSANAINRLITGAALMAGASLGGLLIAATTPGWGIAVDAATFGIAALLYSFIRVPTVQREPSHGPWADLRDGWSEFIRHGWVWAVVLGFLVINAVELGSIHVLGPVVADETIGRSIWGLVLASETAGMAVGALIAMRLRIRRLLYVGVVCTLGASLWLFALAIFPHPAVLLPAGFVTGMAMEQFAVAWEVSIQEHIPADKLARVYSYDQVGSFLAIPLGQMAAGPIAGQIGAPAALLGAGALVVLAVLGMLLHPQVRTLRHTVARPAPEPAPTPVQA
jgi:MFS family permease